MAHVTLNFTLEHEAVAPEDATTCDDPDCDQPGIHRFTSPALGGFARIRMWACNEHVNTKYRIE